jgi:hypothetical protein
MNMEEETKMGFALKESAEEIIKKMAPIMLKEGEDYFLGILEKDGTNIPIIYFKDDSYIQMNKDKTIDWHTKIFAIGLHIFIHIVTGKEKYKEHIICLCPLKQHHITFFEALVSTTRGEDGKFGSKDADMYLAFHNRALKVKVILKELSVFLVLLRILPPDRIYASMSDNCPYCNEVRNEVENEGSDLRKG